MKVLLPPVGCLLYTSDAADDLIGVDLGGRRIIKKKKRVTVGRDDARKDYTWMIIRIASCIAVVCVCVLI